MSAWQTNPKKILRAAFAALTDRQRARLREHARRKTKILCGESQYDWVGFLGGA